MRELQEWREEDRERAPEDKRHRTLTFAAFQTLCRETGRISDPVQFLQFLHFLHNAGLVFWRENLFQSRVILDQAWVLDAVYTVFHRDNCLDFLRRHHGRFTRSDLGMLLWDKTADREGYGQEEQELFLSFMESCGICFVVRQGSEDVETEYVAPDHLPEGWEPEARLERWGQAAPDAGLTFTYDSLPPALMRNLIGRIGTEAGLSCDYWRNGFYGYESRTDARVLVEQEKDDRWQGAIRIQARGRRAGELVAEMEKTLLEEERRLGLDSEREEPVRPEGRLPEREGEPPKLDFVPEPLEKRTYYVSYAWEDDRSESGKTRAEIVDGFCARAKGRDIIVNRDKDVMRLGDRISTFMKRIARGDRVIVVLSDKYLRSPFCMYELYEIWLQARGEDERFLKRIRLFTQEDAKIWTPLDRAGYAIHWSEEYQKHQEVIKQHGLHVFGDKDKAAISLMQKFSSHIGDILTITTDILQPKNLDELVSYSFDGGDFDD